MPSIKDFQHPIESPINPNHSFMAREEVRTPVEDLPRSYFVYSDKNNTYLESEDSEGNSISVDVSKTLESNKGLLEHPFYN